MQGTGLIGAVVRPVPASRLYTSATKSAHGLKAEYFANTDLTGEPVLRRIDPSVNFIWGFNGVSSQLKQNYSVRWTGVLAPAESARLYPRFYGAGWLSGVGRWAVARWRTGRRIVRRRPSPRRFISIKDIPTR